jgi:uncharacterized protein
MDDPVESGDLASGLALEPVVPPDDALRELLADAHTIAVVGLSSKPGRPALDIASHLQRRGYRVVPVHPRETEVLGERVYPTLQDIPNDIRIDIVDVFRRADETPEVARGAVAIGAKALWLQQDIVSEEAGRIASEAGLIVIMGVCIKQMIMRLDAARDARDTTDERGEPS